MKLTPKMEEIASKVLEEMEKGGVMPWEKPWFYQALMNWKTKRAYQGMNVLSLAYSLQESGLKIGQFLTYRQAQEAGGQVKTGSKGFPVCFFSMIETKGKDGEKEKFPLMKTAIVFGVEQVDGIKPRDVKARALTVNQLAEKIMKLSGAVMKENSASTYAPAFCENAGEYIEFPARHLWKSDEAFYSTVFHELIHWTGAKERLNRQSFAHYREQRALEELTAEMGAAFLASYVGFKYDTQHTAYVIEWAKMLTDKKEMLYKACSQAQKAVNLLLELAGEIDPAQNKDTQEPAQKTA